MSVPLSSGPVIVDTTSSPYARLKPVAISAIKLNDSIWAPRRRITFDQTIPGQYQLLESTGRIANFRRAAGKETGEFIGIYFNDSDVYKWLEAAAWSLAIEPNPELDSLLDRVIGEIAEAQRPDGYLNTFFQLGDMEQRWSNMKQMHQLYCAGHLIQAAVAHVRATGKTNLLDIACKFADLICDTFGPLDQGKRPGTDGHEEIELAMIELGRATGHRRYYDQGEYFMNARGEGHAGGDEYHQDHLPFRETSVVGGHAVRQVYLTAGGADLYLETGDEAVLAALDRLWTNMTTRRMYISSGIGSRYDGEAFGKDFELGNARAYTESCAAIGNAMWNWRMLLIRGEAKYADLLEQALYNGMLPGLALAGDAYFYQNPLADDGNHRRQPWFDVACCPPNIARTLASITGYMATVRDDELALHLYAQSQLDVTLPTGQRVLLDIDTNYPWDGQIRITVKEAGEYALKLRIPGWAKNASLRINGDPVEADLMPENYVALDWDWAAGDEVELDLPMPVRRMLAHPALFENTTRIALFRGPLLYCLEQAGNGVVDPRTIIIGSDTRFSTAHDASLLGGVTVVIADAQQQMFADAWNDRLYLELNDTPEPVEPASCSVAFIPYFVWANREAGPMEVWIRATSV